MTDEISRSVEPFAGNLAERVGDEFLGGQLLPIQVAATQAAPPM